MEKIKIKSKQYVQILLVEDAKDQALFIAKILDASDYKVVWVKDGMQALDIMKKGFIPDLMISDIKMPALNGFELLNEMRRLEIYVPTIISSGTGSIVNFEEAYSLGAKSYLIKPFSPEQLLARVQTILKAGNTDQQF